MRGATAASAASASSIAASRAMVSAETSTSVSTNATIGALVAANPALRAAAGPRLTGSRSAAPSRAAGEPSSTTTALGKSVTGRAA